MPSPLTCTASAWRSSQTAPRTAPPFRAGRSTTYKVMTDGLSAVVDFQLTPPGPARGPRAHRATWSLYTDTAPALAITEKALPCRPPALTDTPGPGP